MSQYIIRTSSGYLWLIEDAENESDALRQYYGSAEPYVWVDLCDEEGMADFLRAQGQAS